MQQISILEQKNKIGNLHSKSPLRGSDPESIREKKKLNFATVTEITHITELRNYEAILKEKKLNLSSVTEITHITSIKMPF